MRSGGRILVGHREDFTGPGAEERDLAPGDEGRFTPGGFQVVQVADAVPPGGSGRSGALKPTRVPVRRKSATTIDTAVGMVCV